MAQKTERRVLRLKSLISHQITEVKDKRRPILNQRNSGILIENKSHEDKHGNQEGRTQKPVSCPSMERCLSTNGQD